MREFETDKYAKRSMKFNLHILSSETISLAGERRSMSVCAFFEREPMKNV